MTKANLTISVVIPAYNAARFLPRCLGSVSTQTLQPTEVIVVDDGSTDDTATIAASLGARVLRRPNGGLSAARNTGIRGATGDWIALLDADDMWASEKLRRQVACIASNSVLVYTGIRVFDDSGIRSYSPAVSPKAARKMLRYSNPITPSTVLVRRDAVAQGGGFREDIRACEDWEMWVRLQRMGQFEAVPDPLTDYYVYPNSLSASPERMLQALDRILDTTLLADLHGFEYWVWKRRILASQLCSAGLIARDNGLKNDLHYMIRSWCAWPSPLWDPRRFAISAVSVMNIVRGHNGAL